MNRGLTLPNRQWDDYTAAELAALVDLAPETLVWLLYGGDIDKRHAEQLFPFLDSHRTTRHLVRPYAGNIPQWNPGAWADECWKRYLQMPQECAGAIELIPANEMNLAVEGGSEDWQAQIAWLRAFAARWRAIAPHVPLHLPALSPSGNFGEGWIAYGAAGLFDLFDVVDVHIYQIPPDPMPRTPLTQLTGKPICVTEFNQVPIPQMAQAMSLVPAVRDVCYFILGGTTDQAQYDILRLPDVYQSFKAWRPPVDPQTVTTFTVGQGVAQKLKDENDVALSDEQYVGSQMSFTFGAKGLYIYSKQANKTFFLPAA